MQCAKQASSILKSGFEDGLYCQHLFPFHHSISLHIILPRFCFLLAECLCVCFSFLSLPLFPIIIVIFRVDEIGKQLIGFFSISLVGLANIDDFQ